MKGIKGCSKCAGSGIRIFFRVVWVSEKDGHQERVVFSEDAAKKLAKAVEGRIYERGAACDCAAGVQRAKVKYGQKGAYYKLEEYRTIRAEAGTVAA